MTPTPTPHWLTGTTDAVLDDVLELVHRLTQGADFEVKPGRWMYGVRYLTVEGIEVLADPLDPATMPPVCVNVPGAGCDLLGPDALRELVVGTDMKPTRVDFAWDGVPFTVDQVRGWVEGANMRTRLRSATVHRAVMGSGGSTVSLGSRHGSAEVVVYDRRGPVRLEFRMRKERAASVRSVLAGPVEAWASEFLQLLRGVVDFVDRSQGTRGDRVPLLPSWEAFVAGAERVVVALGRGVADSLERATGWFRRQVAKTAGMLEDAGVDLARLIEDARDRRGHADRIRLHGWRLGPPALTSTA